MHAEETLHDAMRGAHLQMEYENVEARLRAWNVQSTIVVFGSSRVSSSHRWYQAARRFSFLMAAREQPPGTLRHVITTGGGPGIMEAANRGAFEADMTSIGFNIDLPVAQPTNRFVTPALRFHFHYFAIRKFHFAMRAAALVVFPGGFGTIDELFEILTLQQTQKMEPARVLLYDRGFWNDAINFRALHDAGVIGDEDLAQLHFADTPEEASALLADA